MEVSWDESFFEHGQVEAPTYWVCFWTAGKGSSAMHDPVRVEGAESVDEVIEWINATRGTRGYELFVEADDLIETRVGLDRQEATRASGWRLPAGFDDCCNMAVHEGRLNGM